MTTLRRVVGDLELSAGPSERGPDWCALWLDEGLEDAMGETAFAELPDRLVAILGPPADRVVWEDREVLLVRAPGTSHGGVLDALVRLVELP